MTLPRWLAALVVATGLLAMHGITASTAAAAVPCGVTVPHGHHGTTAEPGDPGVGAPQMSAAAVDLSHEGALCLAILAGGLLVGLLLRSGRRHQPSLLAAGGVRSARRVGRPPPASLLPLLCVSRT